MVEPRQTKNFYMTCMIIISSVMAFLIFSYICYHFFKNYVRLVCYSLALKKQQVEEGQWINPGYLSSQHSSQNSFKNDDEVNEFPVRRQATIVMPKVSAAEIAMKSPTVSKALPSLPQDRNSFSEAVKYLSENDPYLKKYMPKKYKPRDRSLCVSKVLMSKQNSFVIDL